MLPPNCYVTAEQVRELFNYDHETGVLYWKKYHRGVRKSLVAGNKTKFGYLATSINQIRYKNHRLIWLFVYGEWPKHEIDHINHIRDDNRIENLRDVPRYVNGQNQCVAHSDNACGVIGVSWQEKRQSYRVGIKSKGKNVFLGMFIDLDQAREAYITAKRELHAGCTI